MPNNTYNDIDLSCNNAYFGCVFHQGFHYPVLAVASSPLREPLQRLLLASFEASATRLGVTYNLGRAVRRSTLRGIPKVQVGFEAMDVVTRWTIVHICPWSAALFPWSPLSKFCLHWKFVATFRHSSNPFRGHILAKNQSLETLDLAYSGHGTGTQFSHLHGGCLKDVDCLHVEGICWYILSSYGKFRNRHQQQT